MGEKRARSWVYEEIIHDPKADADMTRMLAADLMWAVGEIDRISPELESERAVATTADVALADSEELLDKALEAGLNCREREKVLLLRLNSIRALVSADRSPSMEKAVLLKISEIVYPDSPGGPSDFPVEVDGQ